MYQPEANPDFPFSAHDNKHSLQNWGEYFDSGLGRRKVAAGRRQHNSSSSRFWKDDPECGRFLGSTSYKEAFVAQGSVPDWGHRRFPRHHGYRWAALPPRPASGCGPIPGYGPTPDRGPPGIAGGQTGPPGSRRWPLCGSSPG
ncbi:testis-expressed protein 36 [Tachyglossus aculeatus]|uniref:testis-expressed protein 36 n=1 Tax=Tachyglossus aculeatus TaxID=9261 RepID=UPI0018F64568|nr:testis-expressed protein 36 [Tachyglossus aculeatus]